VSKNKEVRKEVAEDVVKEKSEQVAEKPPQNRTIVIEVPYNSPALLTMNGLFSRYELIGLFQEILDGVKRMSTQQQ